MRLVERVIPGGLAQSPQVVGHAGVGAGVDAPLHELVAQRGHELLVLLAHRLAQVVRAGGREPRERAGDLHELLLVHRHRVRGARDGLQPGVGEADAAGVTLVARIGGDERHGAGAVERHQRHQVGELRGAHLAEGVAHARRLELEHPQRVAAGQHAVGGRVIHGNGLDVEVLPRGVAHQPQGVLDDVQVAQAQEVHLQQAEGLDVVVGNLGDHGPLVVHPHRQVVGHRARRDDDAGGVHALVAHQALQRTRDLHDASRRLVGLHRGRELAAGCGGLVQLDAQLVGHELRDAVHLAVGDAQHAT